jgi:hypothetical protein
VSIGFIDVRLRYGISNNSHSSGQYLEKPVLITEIIRAGK